MEQGKNKIGVIFLIVILLIFIIGGFVLMKIATTENSSSNKTKTTIDNVADLRLDKTKDFVYYENDEEVIESLEIEYMDAIINFESMAAINNTLAQEVKSMKNTIKYVKDMDVEIPEGTDVNEEGIYSLEYRDYIDYSSGSYVSLVVEDFKYDLLKGIDATSLKSYVIDKNTASVIDNDVLLTNNNLDMDQVKEKIKEKLNNERIISNDDNEIDVTATINNLATYALYINKYEKLEIAFIVKASKNNYVETLELT